MIRNFHGGDKVINVFGMIGDIVIIVVVNWWKVFLWDTYYYCVTTVSEHRTTARTLNREKRQTSFLKSLYWLIGKLSLSSFIPAPTFKKFRKLIEKKNYLDLTGYYHDRIPWRIYEHDGKMKLCYIERKTNIWFFMCVPSCWNIIDLKFSLKN